MIKSSLKPIISQIEQAKFSNPEKACELCEELKKNTSLSPDPIALGFTHMIQGEMVIFHQADYSRAAHHLITGLRYLEDTDSHEYLIRSYYLLGVSFSSLQDYMLSIDYFLNTLRVLDLHDIPVYRCRTAYRIGMIFNRFENHERAIEYFLRSSSLEKKVNYCYTSGKSLLHLGLSMAKTGKQEEGLAHSLKGFSILRQSELAKDEYSYAHSVLSAVYYISGDTDKSYQHFRLAEHFYEPGTPYPFYPDSVLFYIQMLIEDKRYEDAVSYIDSLYDLYAHKADHSSCSTICHLAIQIFEAVKNQQMANYYYELYFLHTQHKLRSISRIENSSLETKSLCEQLRKSNETLARLTSIDTLTGLANKPTLFKHMEELLQNGRSQQKPLGVMMLDIDNFKMLNDKYGHVTGDICLKEISTVLKQAEQIYGTFGGRFGGDELLLVSYDKTEEDLQEIAAYIQDQIRTIHIASLAADNNHASLSIGLYSAIPTRHDTILNFIQNADDDLYKSKQYLQ